MNLRWFHMPRWSAEKFMMRTVVELLISHTQLCGVEHHAYPVSLFGVWAAYRQCLPEILTTIMVNERNSNMRTVAIEAPSETSLPWTPLPLTSLLSISFSYISLPKLSRVFLLKYHLPQYLFAKHLFTEHPLLTFSLLNISLRNIFFRNTPSAC